MTTSTPARAAWSRSIARPPRSPSSWSDVPEFGNIGANSFSITLKRGSNQAEIEYGALSATDGLAGVSCGGAVASGFENEQNLRGKGTRRTINMNDQTAAFEIFTEADNDLSDYELLFSNMKQGFGDVFEPNNSLARARSVQLPFSTETVTRHSTIAPAGADVDYYRFSVRAGDIFAIEVVRGTFDALVGVFDADSGQLLVLDDDGGAGLLSRLLLQTSADLHLAVAVTTFPDFGFTGAGDGGGRYVLVDPVVPRHRAPGRGRHLDSACPGDAVPLPGPELVECLRQLQRQPDVRRRRAPTSARPCRSCSPDRRASPRSGTTSTPRRAS